MKTQCSAKSLEFHPLGNRKIVARFDGGAITSEAGGLLLRGVEKATGVIRQFARCFTDHRNAESIEHSVGELAGQRLYGLCLGYEDLNDHDALRHDPLPATLVDKLDPTGRNRKRACDCGKALAGKSTLNRLELTKERARDSGGKLDRYKRIEVIPSQELFHRVHENLRRLPVLNC